MALVEGFGDEVIQVFGVLFIVVLVVLLWMSTQVAEMQIFRGAVFILERRTRRRHHDTARTIPVTPLPSINERPTIENDSVNVVDQTNTTLSDDSLQNKDNENAVAIENDVTESNINSNESSQSTCSNDATNEPETYEDSIKIRLKYLNDNCRLVDGRLQENVGVFKRRHFSSELSSNKIIRLIFQGKVLHDDEASLSSCGIHDNCVVHCLIHQPRPTINAHQTHDPVNHENLEQPRPNMIRPGQRQPVPVHREWNLATLLSALITVIISLLWYARIQFYTLFSYTSTSTLGILTGIFMFTAFLTYLVDSEEQQHQRQQTEQQ